MSSKIFIAETLEAWKEIDPNRWQKLVNEILEIFFSTAPKQYQELVKATAEKNWDSVRQISHSLKSGCGNVGAESSFLLLSEIEKCAEDNQDQVPELVEKLSTIFALTLVYITEYKNKIQPTTAVAS